MSGEKEERPRVVACLAAGPDGKIATVHGEAALGSREDRSRLARLRREADAIVVGAATIRREDPPYPTEVTVAVVSRSGRLPVASKLLAGEARAPRILAVPEDLALGLLGPLSEVRTAGRLDVLRAGRGGVDIAALLAELGRRGAREVLLEGGGETLASFLAAGAVDELRLTLVPRLVGGREAPALVGGPGWALAEAPRLELLEVERAGGELFLRYAVLPPAPGSPGGRRGDGGD